ncbi:DUF6438 domain-containing protein [Flavobacterium sp.]|uniref:DUF6438 domain-containing protein n=1 Tax=Flavobacterium sp. TaxID=239 RepID=UPI002622DD32|nr:DUF6438 domain-containing protein [Flavobacterium sp.]
MNKICGIATVALLIIGCASKKKEPQFDKVIFHTSKCFGTCPEYHLEINDNKEIKLFIEKAYIKRTLDTSKIGYYKGKLGNETYDELTNLIKTIDLQKSGIIEPKQEPNTITNNEGTQLSVLLYNNKKRKPIIYIYPAGHWRKLMKFVYEVAADDKLIKTTEKLNIEAFN